MTKPETSGAESLDGNGRWVGRLNKGRSHEDGVVVDLIEQDPEVNRGT